MSDRDVYMREGEMVTCQNGHPIARVTRDCYVGEVMMADMLDWQEGIKPRVQGDLLGKCDICGKAFNGSDLDETKPTGLLHFADGWRR